MGLDSADIERLKHMFASAPSAAKVAAPMQPVQMPPTVQTPKTPVVDAPSLQADTSRMYTVGAVFIFVLICYAGYKYYFSAGTGSTSPPVPLSKAQMEALRRRYESSSDSANAGSAPPPMPQKPVAPKESPTVEEIVEEPKKDQ